MRPVDDPNLALTWTSSDETVVQVDQTGYVHRHCAGTAVIGLRRWRAYSAQCQVTVLENNASLRRCPESAWYYEAVQYTSAHGLFQGMTETKFGPNLTMTRGMLVTVLYRMEEPAVEGQTHPFHRCGRQPLLWGRHYLGGEQRRGEWHDGYAICP